MESGLAQGKGREDLEGPEGGHLVLSMDKALAGVVQVSMVPQLFSW